jgi:hypothetical protein
MATWKKLIVSGSDAHLSSVTASNSLAVGTNQIIGTTSSTTQLSGSFSGSFFGDGSGLSGVAASFPITQKTPIVGTDQVFINDGASKYATVSQFNSSSWAGVSGDILIDGTTGVATIQANSVALGTDTTGNYVATVSGSGAIISSATTGEGSTPTITLDTASATFTGGVVSALPSGTVSGSSFSSPSQGTVRATINGVNTDVDTGLQTGDSPQFVDLTLTGDITVGGNDIKSNGGTTVFTLSGANATVAGNLTVSGDMTVTGNVTELQVTNLNVEDQFALLASGSGTTDAGIVAASGSATAGSALYHDITDQRWAVAKSVASNATAVTALEYVTTVKVNTSSPSTQEYGVGEMHVNTSTGDIWIYS